MVAAAALGDVVQQHRHIERAARLQLVDQLGRDRRDLGQLAALQLLQHADRLDRVLVDGEDMVGVELHLPDDARPVRDEAAEEPGLVQIAASARHRSGCRGRRLAPHSRSRKSGAGFRVAAQRGRRGARCGSARASPAGGVSSLRSRATCRMRSIRIGSRSKSRSGDAPAACRRRARSPASTSAASVSAATAGGPSAARTIAGSSTRVSRSDVAHRQELVPHEALDAVLPAVRGCSPCGRRPPAAGRRSAAPRPGRRRSAGGSGRSRGSPRRGGWLRLLLGQQPPPGLSAPTSSGMRWVPKA